MGSTAEGAGDLEVAVVPETDGDLSAALELWEEFLLLLADIEADPVEDAPLPAPLAGREVLDVLGELGVQVRRLEEAAVTPVAPGGRAEIPVLFVPLTTSDRQRLIEGLRLLIDAAQDRGGGHPLIGEALESFQASHTPFSGGSGARSHDDDIERLVAVGRRLLALLEVPVDHDAQLLRAVLAQPEAAGGQVGLTTEAHDAYLRVTEQLLASWHGNDPLERFVYRGP